MSLIFKNNATTTLSGSINDTQTAITVAGSSLFPVLSGGDYFYATMYEVSGATEINVEIVKVTGITSNTWTVVRAQEGTPARIRSGVTVYIELRMTAASATLLLQKDNNLSDVASVATARTNLGLGTLATQAADSVAITGGSISGVVISGVDSTTTIQDNADPSKKVQFEVASVAAGTTRTLTVPNNSGTIALTSDLTAGYQPLDSDLTAIAGLAANGLIARTATGTAAVRTIAVPAAGLSINNPDGVAGNPTLALANDLAAVEGLSTTGFVRRTAADTWSAASIADGDLPSALTGKTYNAVTPTANATGFSVAGGTTSKTLTVNNTVTLAGTDGTTITLPASSGTVALNNQTHYIGTTAVAINRASAAQSLTGVNIDGSAGSATTATTATKATNLVGGNATTLLGALPYQSNTDTTIQLAPNVTATKKFLNQTGTGTNGAAPVWGDVTKTDVGLANVENTAISTFTGSANIATVGTVTSGVWNGTAVPLANGGTGATTKVAAFDALSPATTLGDTIYHDGTDNVRLAGNITTTKKFMRQTGNGATSAIPAWDTLVDADIPAALTGKTINGLSLTAAATGFTVAGGTSSKTLTVSNTLSLSGTDASTLNIGAGGTLGSAAYTASTAYSPVAGSASINTVGTITSGTWTGSAIGLSSGGTGQTSKTAGYNALSPMSTLGDTEYHDGTNGVRLAGNTLAAKRFLTQTGNGTVSAAPGWNALIDGDIPSALTGKTYNGITPTANATGFQLAGGTTAKTFVVSNNLTLAGTDGSTLNVGAGGTLGTAAYTASTAYEPAITTLGVSKGGTGVGTLTGLVKGNGTAAMSAAAAGTDYMAPASTINLGTTNFALNRASAVQVLTGISVDGSAGSVTNASVIKFDTGVTEDTDLYTFNGSAAKTVDIKAGANVTLTKAANTITISANDTSVAWTEVTGKPTTVAGYGITDASGFPSGTLMLFQQTAAPTGWTKQTTHNDKALRVVSGTAGSGGTSAFTTIFASRTPAGSVSVSGGSVGATTLATTQIPSHTHTVTGGDSNTGASNLTRYTGTSVTSSNTGASGGGGSHTHGFTAPTASFTGTDLSFAVQYVDLIIASKD